MFGATATVRAERVGTGQPLDADGPSPIIRSMMPPRFDFRPSSSSFDFDGKSGMCGMGFDLRAELAGSSLISGRSVGGVKRPAATNVGYSR